MPDLKKYNFGCGKNHLEGYVNVDVDPELKPDLVVDLTKPPFPIESDSAKQILFIHTIEHIDKWFHFNIMAEFQRILHPEGTIWIAFPEFAKIADNWIQNHKGQRDYWEAAIYGRATSFHDRHVCCMRSVEFKELMIECGFKDIKISPEPLSDYNTLISASKGVRLPTYEEHINDKVFGITEQLPENYHG